MLRDNEKAHAETGAPNALPPSMQEQYVTRRSPLSTGVVEDRQGL